MSIITRYHGRSIGEKKDYSSIYERMQFEEETRIRETFVKQKEEVR